MFSKVFLLCVISQCGAAVLRSHRALHTQRASLVTRTSLLCARVDFSGKWEMDLSASDALGPVLKELGMNRIVAALIARVGVEQEISQHDSSVSVRVRTAVSQSEINLQFDGSVTQTPSMNGGDSATVSRWLDDNRLETRQRLDDCVRFPADEMVDCFVTVRSLGAGGNTLQEEVIVMRQGEPVPGACARRILRRVQ